MKRQPATSALRKRIETLQAQLNALLAELYRDKQAEEIRASFEAALAAAADDEERVSVLEYWHDFYRLQQYKRLKTRRRPTYHERTTPCAACGYPSSHRHHLWDIATHGENKVTIQLCANCHELHHLMYNALVRESEYSRAIITHIMFSGAVKPEVIQKVLGWCLATIRYEANNQWIDGSKGSREAVEKQLRWSEYLRSLESKV